MGYWLGLDVGTTFSAAGVARADRVEIVGLGNYGAVVPSLLFLRDDGTFLVGEAAGRRGLAEPGRLARGVKRRFGDPTPVLLGGSPFSADALTSHLVRYLLGAVTEQEGGPPDAVAVTCPANWGPFKIDLLRQALRGAGLDDPVVLSEPEAAAVFYASTERVEPGQAVAIYDLGGGTFDAAVLRKTESGFELLGEPEGIERLGGIDFDEAVLAHVQGFLGDSLSGLDTSDPTVLAALARLRADCVSAKEALSADTDVSIPVILPTVQTEIRLTRNEFESMIRPTLTETTAVLGRALRSAGVKAEDLRAVLLVGGSSRIPLVGQMVAAELGRPVSIDVHPKHAVAEGAAIAAGRALGLVDPSPPAPPDPIAEAPAAVAPASVAPAAVAPAGVAVLPEPVVPAADVAARSPAVAEEVEVAAVLSTGGAVGSVPVETAPLARSGDSGAGDPAPREAGNGRPRRPWLIGAAVGAVVVAAVVVGLLTRGGKKTANSPPPHPPQVPTYNVQMNASSIASGAGSLWLGDSSSPSVVRFDPVSHQTVVAIRVGNGDGHTWVAYGADAVWAVNDGSTQLHRIDPATNKETATYDVGRQPHDVLVAAGAVWVASPMDRLVTRVDPTSGQTMAIHLRGQPTHLAFSSDTLWISDPDNSTVARIDTTRNVALADIPSGGCPDYLVADSAAVWVQDECKVSSVFKVDPNGAKVVATLPVGRDAKGIVEVGDFLYVANSTDGTVSVVNRNTLATRTVVVGSGPTAIGVDGATVWVSNSSDGTLSRVDG